jgi:GNAT superfamily N-acetyltransferase
VSVSRRIVPLTLDNLNDLPIPCRSCTFWELGPLADPNPLPTEESTLAKEAWLSATLLDWGSCGKIAYVAGVPAGYALFAPPGFVPRALSFATSPVSGDAVLLMNAHVLPEWRSAGLGRMLAQSVAAELVPRGVKAIEAFGSTGPSSVGCLMPADYLRSVGFKTIRPHPRFPRLRMELKSTVSWRSDVEYALERIFGTTVAKSLTPAG